MIFKLWWSITATQIWPSSASCNEEFTDWGDEDWDIISDGVKARAPKAKAVVLKDKVINQDQGLRQGHDEPTQYHFLWHKYLPVTNSVY